MTVKTEESKSRRGLTKYITNPFFEGALSATRTRVRKVPEKNGEKMMVLNTGTGELMGPAGFWHAEEVDRTQFVKLYINGVKAFKELTASGTKVFEFLYLEMQSKMGKDTVHLSFQMVNQDTHPISEATFYRGMRELINKQFIAESNIQGKYFVNPDYLWNGDRLAFVREYKVKREKQAIDDRTLDLFDQSAISGPAD